jgi:caa(3)-type oxidase subunit IV
MTATREQTAVERRVEHAHPGPRAYVQIAIILAVLTAIEVALSYLGFVKALTITGMLIVMAIKFSLVVMWYMHLRFDSRLFSVMFVGGLGLALAVFIAVLTIQRVFFA